MLTHGGEGLQEREKEEPVEVMLVCAVKPWPEASNAGISWRRTCTHVIRRPPMGDVVVSKLAYMVIQGPSGPEQEWHPHAQQTSFTADPHSLSR